MIKPNLFQSKIVRIMVAGISGVLFGSGMTISGMVDPHNVIAFLDIFGDWDPSLAFVMGGALLVFSPFYHLVIKKRKTAINGEAFSYPSNNKIDGTLLSGAVIFGAGWGLAGMCPGPAITNIASGSGTVLAFVISMTIGMVAANKYIAGRCTLPLTD